MLGYIILKASNRYRLKMDDRKSPYFSYLSKTINVAKQVETYVREYITVVYKTESMASAIDLATIVRHLTQFP